MRIPDVAKRLCEIAEEIQGDYPQHADELVELAGELPRARPGRVPQSPALP